MQVGGQPPPVIGRVAVVRLTMHDFRCHRFLRLDLGVGPTTGRGALPVVLTGANGTGKTSVLEALSLLMPGRGLRRARLGDMLRRDAGATAPAWSVAARLATPSGPTDVVTGFAAAQEGSAPVRERRQISLDGQPRRPSEARAINAVWLTPEMDRLFVEGPSGRRRFLDRIVWGLDPTHATRVAAFERAMQQRAVLLRQHQADPAWLSALEETMAAHGVAVAAARRLTADQLSDVAVAAAPPFPPARIACSGPVDAWLDEGPALAAEERLKAALALSRRADAETGGAAVGPHRTDMMVLHAASGRAARDCSTGEQKMLLIALVLAAARLQCNEGAVVPLILLDEVVAHLDARHREAVFAAAAATSAQVWYVGTDRRPFEPLTGEAHFVVMEEASRASTAIAAAAGLESDATDDRERDR